MSKLELALKIKKYVKGLKITQNNIKKDPDKRNYIVSNQKILKTGWRPKYSLDNGILELLNFYSNFKLKKDSNNLSFLKK